MDSKYLSNATDSRHWENRPEQIGTYYSILENLAGDLKGKKLLDVGCAIGIDTRYFHDKGLDAVGLDIREDFISEAQKKFPSIKFLVGDAENLPFKDQVFDIVFSTNTLFYTILEKSLKEFIRVTRPGGFCIFSFDIAIKNLDENKIIHSDTINHLREIITQNTARIVYLSDEVKRIDFEPFRHEHTFRIAVVQRHQLLL